jgi:hypothetical protein
LAQPPVKILLRTLEFTYVIQNNYYVPTKSGSYHITPFEWNNKIRTKKNTMNYDQNVCQQFSFITPLFSHICRRTKNKSWRRCRLYFRGRMQCWWIFDFETDYTLTTGWLLMIETNLAGWHSRIIGLVICQSYLLIRFLG